MNSGATNRCNGQCSSCPASALLNDASCEADQEGLKGWVAAGNKADQLDGLRGWPMVYRTALAFLMPSVSALIGAFLAGESQQARFCGMLVGLVSGVALAWLISKIVDRFTVSHADTESIIE